MPLDVTFNFGHTHKPFEEDMNFRDYRQWVNVYNTGGWVVETIEAEPMHGGAVVLVDENLNATSLRMYNEKSNPEEYRVEVRGAKHPGESPSKFHQRIESSITRDKKFVRAFSDSVASAVRV